MSWFLILKLGWGLTGAAITLNTSWWVIVIAQFGYIWITTSDGAWSGFSWLAFSDLYSFVKLSLASAVMLCLEFWYMMILVVITGRLANPIIHVDALSICMHINGWDIMIAFGFNAAISRVEGLCDYSSLVSIEASQPKQSKFLSLCCICTPSSPLTGYPMLDNEPNMWNRLRPQIESMAHEAIKKLGHFPGISRFHIPNLNSCLVRANRMSVTTKLIIESLSTGTLKSTQFKIIGSCKNKGVYQNKAYPSVNLFSRLVDAVEHAWVLSSGLGHMLRDDVEPLSECNHKFKVWCLNEEGIVDFLHRLEYVIEKDKKLIDKEKVEASAKANDKGKSITP